MTKETQIRPTRAVTLCAAVLLMLCAAFFYLEGRADALGSGGTLRVVAPEGSTVWADGAELDPAEAATESPAILAGREAYLGGEVPKQRVWRLEGLSAEPELTARGADGQRLHRVVSGAGEVRFAPPEDEALRETAEQRVRDFMNLYTLYAGNPYYDSVYYGLLGSVLPNTALYDHIVYSADAMVWACATKMEFDELSVSDFQRVGENGFTCTVRYRAQCSAATWYDSFAYELGKTYELAFVYQGWTWYAAAMSALDEGAGQSRTLLPGVELVEIVEGMAKGRLLIVQDPTRVILGVSDNLGQQAGLQMPDMVAKYKGVAGVNAGGFNDENGLGNGGIPQGLVIREGKRLWGSGETTYNVVGLDGEGVLRVGTMTGSQALEQGICYGVSFITYDGVAAPLLLDGEVQTHNRTGVNPRTAIGQRADKALLLLVLDGRCLDTLGATVEETANILLKYGAVNAGNLDGGSSSVMVYDGDIISNAGSVTGTRYIPTGFIVLPEEASHGG